MRRFTPILFATFTICIVGIVTLRNIGRGDRFFELFSALPHHDKIGHFMLMGILSLLAVVAISPRLRLPPTAATTTVIAALIAIISLEEISQRLVPTRTFSLLDLTFSIAGALSFGITGHVLTARSQRTMRYEG